MVLRFSNLTDTRQREKINHEKIHRMRDIMDEVDSEET